MENQEVKHYQINGKYRIKLERAASTKGVIGYTVEVNGDMIEDVIMDARSIQLTIEGYNPMPVAEAK
jgi:hypothetical protein